MFLANDVQDKGMVISPPLRRAFYVMNDMQLANALPLTRDQTAEVVNDIGAQGWQNAPTGKLGDKRLVNCSASSTIGNKLTTQGDCHDSIFAGTL